MARLKVDDDELPEPPVSRDDAAWNAVAPESLPLRGGYFAIAVVWLVDKDGE